MAYPNETPAQGAAAALPGEGDNSDRDLCIGYVLSYREPHYIRTQSLLQALARMPGVRVIIARNTSKGIWRYFETWRALRRMRAMSAPDIYILGFRGHEFFWPLRLLIRKTHLVFDAFMSPYAALYEENKAGFVGRLIAPLIYRLERRMLQQADLVLTDTHLQVQYFVDTFALSHAKVCSLPVGAIETEDDTKTIPLPDAGPFRVLFYGSFLPLHGVDVILEAASRLSNLPVFFDFIGGNLKHGRWLRDQCERMNIVRYTHRAWVPFEELISNEIPRTNLCLGGPFGGTPQARRVVTGKTSQCLALAKATVIGRIDEQDGFVDRGNCLLVDQDDAVALAEAIRWAYENRSQLDTIGACGRALYRERLSIDVIAERLLPALRNLSETNAERATP